MKAIQDYYPEEFSHCYGCGRNNPHGHQVKTYPDGDETVARFMPEPYHIAVPGYVYGGLIASLVDCHAMGSAAIAVYRAEGRAWGSEPALRFVTASLTIDYLAPTPAGVELELHGRILEIGERKVLVAVDVYAGGRLCARGRAVAVRMPDSMAQTGSPA